MPTIKINYEHTIISENAKKCGNCPACDYWFDNCKLFEDDNGDNIDLTGNIFEEYDRCQTCIEKYGE